MATAASKREHRCDNPFWGQWLMPLTSGLAAIWAAANALNFERFRRCPTASAVPDCRVAGESMKQKINMASMVTVQVVEDFLGSLCNRGTPLSNGEFSLQVLAVIEAGERFMRARGERIPVEL